MKVKEVMTFTPYTCSKEANLGEATELMWKGDCGFLPITGPDGKACGVITDRDICIALGTRNKPAGEITASEASSGNLFACSPEDEIHVALRAEPSGSGKIVELSTDEVVRSFRVINQRELPQVAKKQTAAA